MQPFCQTGVGLPLVPSSQEQNKWPVKRGDSDLGRRDIRGLGIVDPEHALDLPHRLHSMRYGAERLQAGGYAVQWRAQFGSHQCGS